MRITAHNPEDLNQLRQRVDREKKAKKRDRFRAVLEALEGRETLDIAAIVRRSRKFVQHWVYRYRDEGLAALEGKPYPGRRPKLTAEQETQLQARLDAGVRPEDGVCALRGQDIRRIIQQDFGVVYAKNAVYDLLKRLDYAPLRPRPRHRKKDPAAMEQFKSSAPLLSKP
jgi:transposase